MKSMEDLAKDTHTNISEDKQYDMLIEALQEAKEKQLPITEGLFSSILGGTVGITFGPAVMKAVCNALGIDLKGALGNLMTSRLIVGAVGAKIGWRV